MAGLYTPGMPDYAPADLTGDETFAFDSNLPSGQSPQTGAITALSLGFGQSTLAAAGASQGNAAAITTAVTIVTVSASTEGVKLPSVATGLRYTVMVPGTKGVKVYPATGDKISTASTNAAVALVADKANLYVGISATTWAVMKGA